MVRAEAAAAVVKADTAGETATELVAVVVVEVVSVLAISVSIAGVANVEDWVGMVVLPAVEVNTRLPS